MNVSAAPPNPLLNCANEADSDFSACELGNFVQACPSKGRDSNAWIEIELFDDAKTPLSGHPYWIQLPDGRIREGELDDNGFARVDHVAPGNCVVKLPGIDAAEISMVAHRLPDGNRRPDQTDWIEINLVDDDGCPVADAKYRIELPDGDILEGLLDGSGSARLENIPPGDCVIKFPECSMEELAKTD